MKNSTNNKQYTTLTGIEVRSKSELIIYNLLVQMQIDFNYNHIIKKENDEKLQVVADFHFMTQAGKSIVWEHYELVDSSEREIVTIKERWYKIRGFIKGMNYFVTYDNAKGDVDRFVIQEIAIFISKKMFNKLDIMEMFFLPHDAKGEKTATDNSQAEIKHLKEQIKVLKQFQQDPQVKQVIHNNEKETDKEKNREKEIEEPNNEQLPQPSVNTHQPVDYEELDADTMKINVCIEEQAKMLDVQRLLHRKIQELKYNITHCKIFEKISHLGSTSSKSEQEIQETQVDQSSAITDKKHLIIGIGGGGCNIADFIASQYQANIKTIGLNTDIADLKECAHLSHKYAQSSYKGLGLGGNPALVLTIDKEIIDEVIYYANSGYTINIISCLGGGTGSGLTPLVCSNLLDKLPATLINTYFTLPFKFEGKCRMDNAKNTIQLISKLGINTQVYKNDDLVIHGQKDEKLIKVFDVFSQQVFEKIIL